MDAKKIGNLEWQSDISPKNMTWQEAKDYAANLGDGWRFDAAIAAAKGDEVMLAELKSKRVQS